MMAPAAGQSGVALFLNTVGVAKRHIVGAEWAAGQEVMTVDAVLIYTAVEGGLRGADRKDKVERFTEILASITVGLHTFTVDGVEAVRGVSTGVEYSNVSLGFV